jgi:LysR family transcriptional regulator, hydrogen peroxide-inducible genes activator
MEMQQIRYFLALCEELNFTRAAARCRVSQPSLSRGIRSLEEELGGHLFYRSTKRITVSPLGNALRPYLQQIDRFAEQAKRKATRSCAASSTSKRVAV